MPQNSPSFKYKVNHDKISCDCPKLEELHSVDMIAYRFVHKDTTHKNCYLPNRIINPNRKCKDCIEECNCYALSFFNDITEAEKALRYHATNIPTIILVVGDHIASCKLKKSDGLAEKKNFRGHFNFHEFEGTEFKDRFYNAIKQEL